MSDYFKGVTFPWQEVTPSDDAIVRRAVLHDRRLSGCGLNYSGSTLSMAAGVLIVCGRLFRHTAKQTWSVTGAKSGYARLLLTIDVTKASTEDVFEQISIDLEYSSAVDGFSVLRQDDINGSGTIYQTPICVVSLNSSGIKGFESTIIASGDGFYPGRSIAMYGDKITGLGDPTLDTDAVNKKYVDSLSADSVGALSLSGGRVYGDISIGGDDSTESHDLYLRRLVSSIVKSGRLYWRDDGSMRLQGSSDGTIFNYLQLNQESTDLAKPLSLRSGGTSAATAEDARVNLGFTGGITTAIDKNFVFNKVIISDASGKLKSSDVSSAELAFLAGVSSAIQTQLDAKAAAAPSVKVYSNSYHTAHLAKIGKLVICVLVPKTLNRTVLYSESITIDDAGYVPASKKTFSVYSDTSHDTALGNNVSNGGAVTVSISTDGVFSISSGYSYTVGEVSNTYFWKTA